MQAAMRFREGSPAALLLLGPHSVPSGFAGSRSLLAQQEVFTQVLDENGYCS